MFMAFGIATNLLRLNSLLLRKKLKGERELTPPLCFNINPLIIFYYNLVLLI